VAKDPVDCIECSAGNYAPPVLEFSEFDEVPSIFKQVCTPDSPYSSKSACHDHKKKWRVNAKVLMSGKGIPHGMRIGLSFRADFVNDVSGILIVKFMYVDL
jgi:hypothetical protein